MNKKAGKTYIIAETCSNIIGHLDNLELIVQQVYSSGADALKIQLFSAEDFPLSERALKTPLVFPENKISYLIDLCHKYDLDFGASVFNVHALSLARQHKFDFIKLASREYANEALILACQASGLPLIRSIPYEHWGDPTFIALADHLFCIPEYPQTNHSMPFYFENHFGWSSHTPLLSDCLLAVSRGAVIIEKHIFFSEYDPEYNWSISIEDLSMLSRYTHGINEWTTSQ